MRKSCRLTDWSMALRLVRYACPERHSRLLYGAIDGQLVLHAVVNRDRVPWRGVTAAS